MTREYLEKIRESEKSIHQKKMELEALRYKATNAEAVQYDKDRVQSSPDDYLSLAIADIIEIEKQIREDEEQLEAHKGQVYSLVKQIQEPEHRTFIEWYYLNGLTMMEASEKMNISLRSAYYLRDEAVNLLISIK